jgi:hypothetical protein
MPRLFPPAPERRCLVYGARTGVHVLLRAPVRVPPLPQGPAVLRYHTDERRWSALVLSR